MRAVVLLLMLAARPGIAGDEPAPGGDAPPAPAAALEEPEAAPAPAERLQEAIRHYQRREWDIALGQLHVILSDPQTPPDILQEARIYIGEIYYLTDRPDQARSFFNQVLKDDPQYQIDRFKHPPEISSYFESLQAQLQPTKPAFEPQVPLGVYLSSPFGIYHFRHGQRAEGWSLFASQTTCLLASGVLFGAIWSQSERDPATGERKLYYDAGDESTRRQIQALRATQWVATTGLFVSLIGGGLDAGNHWQIQATAGPTLAGVGVQVPF